MNMIPTANAKTPPANIATESTTDGPPKKAPVITIAEIEKMVAATPMNQAISREGFFGRTSMHGFESCDGVPIRLSTSTPIPP